MVNIENTAIITYIDKYQMENLEYDFLTSLFEKAKYTGTVKVLNYGMKKSDADRIRKKFPVDVIDCEKIMPVFSNRYYDIPRIIDTLDDNITHVMTMDGGDIWFQDKVDAIYNCSENGIGCIEEERKIGDDHFTEYCLNKLESEKRKEIEERLLGKNVRNSGVICGPRQMIRKIISDVGKDMLNNSTEYFGIDQLYFDFEWFALKEEQKVTLEEKYNYVLVSNKEKFEIIDGNIYNSEKELVTVVHNAGANWRVMKRPFSNKYINEDQYTDTRDVISK